ncbi:AAA family ATPase [Salinicoccus roseus]|uniref:Protein CR006 P-loop domain-containing protein n=1 Tax=Salinicoccus roseus TaxID=45670 RepID=A0A265E9J7_9STAP|nr:AAA family ATPase [Salinicoccus roseus]OZT78254.1 hypothetical protein CFN03_02955 [Salinicoccus roseus]
MIDKVNIFKDHLPNSNITMDFRKNIGKKSEHRGNEFLIFGRNGTGKTTISKAIYEGSRNHYKDSEVEFIKEDQVLSKSDINEDNIFVYNESFLDDTVKFSSNDKLEAIVMLGDQGNYKNKLDIIYERLKKVDQKLKKYKERREAFDKGKELSKVTEFLKGDNNWAGRQRKIVGTRVNPSVNERLIHNIALSKNEGSIDTLNKDFNDLIDQIEKLNHQEDITEFDFPYTFENKLFSKIKETLVRKIEVKESNTKIKKQIEEVFNNLGKNELEESRDYMRQNKDYCRTCFQKISKEQRESVNEEINNLLDNESIRLFEREIDSLIEDLPLPIKPPIYIEVIDKSTFDYLTDSITLFNEEINMIKELLLEKKRNINNEIDLRIDEVQIIYKRLEESKESYNELIENYREDYINLHKWKRKAEVINNSLAYKEISLHYNEYLKKLSIDNFNEYMIEKLNKIEKHLKAKSESLKAKSNQTSIALEQINKSLSIIFYDENRLNLESEDGHYRVKVRNRYVKLPNLSTGERNVIGLSYFFTLLNRDKRLDEKYKDFLLIVLDDPISSFDFENKIGIYNFIRGEIQSILANNDTSQIIITTHDAEAFSSFDKLFSDIKVWNPSLIRGSLNKTILTTNGLITSQKRGDNLYTQQFEDIYNFAIDNDSHDLENYIGNTMRRVFEAYSTFNYKCGIDELRINPDILDKLDNPKEREFFGRFMVRLLLNNESHGQYQAQFYSDTNVFEFLSRDEKIKCARMVIYYLYRLDELHVRRHLKDIEKDELENNIEEWGRYMI